MSNPTLIDVKQINLDQLETFIYSVINSNEGDFVNFLFLSENIPVNVESHTINFASPFPTVPKILGSLSNSNNSDILSFQLTDISINGFKIVFSIETPDANYVFDYIATTANGSKSLLSETN
jgi:hypothetical protein